MHLARSVYELTASFPKNEQYGLVSQMRRAAISIPSNIAEGAARNHDKELVQFLYIALGSVAELETQLLLARDFGYVVGSTVFSLIDKTKKLLLGLLKYLKNKGSG